MSGYVSTIGGPGDPTAFGTEEEQRAAREEFRRMQRVHAAESSKLARLNYEDVEPGRFGVVTHTPTGVRYRISTGESVDVNFSGCVAYYLVTGVGWTDVVFLEALK